VLIYYQGVLRKTSRGGVNVQSTVQVCTCDYRGGSGALQLEVWLHANLPSRMVYVATADTSKFSCSSPVPIICTFSWAYERSVRPFPVAAPLFMSGMQFGFQALLAKLVFRTGLMQRVGQQLSWQEWSRNGAMLY